MKEILSGLKPYLILRILSFREPKDILWHNHTLKIFLISIEKTKQKYLAKHLVKFCEKQSDHLHNVVLNPSKIKNAISVKKCSIKTAI